jgi:hypothetical protein
LDEETASLLRQKRFGGGFGLSLMTVLSTAIFLQFLGCVPREQTCRREITNM